MSTAPPSGLTSARVIDGFTRTPRPPPYTAYTAQPRMTICDLEFLQEYRFNYICSNRANASAAPTSLELDFGRGV